MIKNKYVAVVPARGGSKRFPKKNIYHLDGKPLIVYSIEYAISCDKINEVYVTTDSEDIAKVSVQAGAKVLKRPEALAGDFVPTADVLKDVTLKLQEQGVVFDFVILLQPTNPLRPKNLIMEAIRKIEEGNYDSLCTLSICDKKLGKIIENQFVPWNYTFGQRSQDLEPLYYENGLIYIIRKELLLQGRIFGDAMFPLIVDHPYGQVDIDTMADMNYAKYIIGQYDE